MSRFNGADSVHKWQTPKFHYHVSTPDDRLCTLGINISVCLRTFFVCVSSLNFLNLCIYACISFTLFSVSSTLSFTVERGSSSSYDRYVLCFTSFGFTLKYVVYHLNDA